MNLINKLLSVFTKKVDDSSPKGKVDSTDVAKVFRSAALVSVSAGVSHLLANLNPEMFGQYQLIATVVLMAVSELSVKFLKNNKK